MMKNYKINSLEETEDLAQELAQKIKPGMMIGFDGELGAGKTTFIRSLYESLGGSEDIIVTSPTFTILQTYPLKNNIELLHLDLYRLDHFQDYQELGLEEDQIKSNIMVIEWISKFPELMEELSYYIEMKVIDEFSREIRMS